jgi:hypothetical protein
MENKRFLSADVVSTGERCGEAAAGRSIKRMVERTAGRRLERRLRGKLGAQKEELSNDV